MLAREALLVSSYFWCVIALGQRDSPLGLIGGMAGLGELLCGGGETLLAPLQVLLEQLDPTVQRSHLTLSLINTQIINLNSSENTQILI